MNERRSEYWTDGRPLAVQRAENVARATRAALEQVFSTAIAPVEDVPNSRNMPMFEFWFEVDGVEVKVQTMPDESGVRR